MKFLVTGGAGFLGRWLVKKLLDLNHTVIALDNLSNGSIENIKEFETNSNFKFISGDVTKKDELDIVFNSNKIDICIHAAAQINVQESLDHPDRAFKSNIVGTYNALESCRKNKTKIVLIGTCMVYDLAGGKAINEEHPVVPKSPYAGSKLAAEELAISYYYGLGLPVVILRPFNIYGPYQKTNMEGGVVSVFIKRYLDGQDLNIFGDGKQTRDLLYVEDCADFVIGAALNDKTTGQTINAGTGKDISVNELAALVCPDKNRIKHIPHHHPQAEIPKLLCDSSKAKNLLGWVAKTSLQEGIKKTMEWMKNNSK
ncbi:MAG: SDR family NAD(P)-dependent oxidoreductase [Candidatus Micrarchaeota archaeon]